MTTEAAPFRPHPGIVPGLFADVPDGCNLYAIIPARGALHREAAADVNPDMPLHPYRHAGDNAHKR